MTLNTPLLVLILTTDTILSPLGINPISTCLFKTSQLDYYTNADAISVCLGVKRRVKMVTLLLANNGCVCNFRIGYLVNDGAITVGVSKN